MHECAKTATHSGQAGQARSTPISNEVNNSGSLSGGGHARSSDDNNLFMFNGGCRKRSSR